jgi:hypothetical protein
MTSSELLELFGFIAYYLKSTRLKVDDFPWQKRVKDEETDGHVN